MHINFSSPRGLCDKVSYVITVFKVPYMEHNFIRTPAQRYEEKRLRNKERLLIFLLITIKNFSGHQVWKTKTQ